MVYVVSNLNKNKKSLGDADADGFTSNGNSLADVSK
jgi:hypothetical protein